MPTAREQMQLLNSTVSTKAVVVSVYEVGANGNQTLVSTMIVESDDPHGAASLVRKSMELALPTIKVMAKGELCNRWTMAGLEEWHRLCAEVRAAE